MCACTKDITQNRLFAALKSCLNDLSYIKAYIPLYDNIAKQKEIYHHFNSFYFSAVAIFNDTLTRAIRVLEDNSQVAGFWYIKNLHPKRINALIKQSETTIDDIKRLSE